MGSPLEMFMSLEEIGQPEAPSAQAVGGMVGELLSFSPEGIQYERELEAKHFSAKTAVGSLFTGGVRSENC